MQQVTIGPITFTYKEKITETSTIIEFENSSNPKCYTKYIEGYDDATIVDSQIDTFKPGDKVPRIGAITRIYFADKDNEAFFVVKEQNK